MQNYLHYIRKNGFTGNFHKTVKQLLEIRITLLI